MTADLATKRAVIPALVRVKGLHKQYVQRRVFSRDRFVVDALRNVDLELQPECFTALVGASGSGKSTLASCLAMLEKPDAGEIWFEEREISRCGARDLAGLRPRIQMVFQDSAGALNPFFSAAQVVAEPLEVQRPRVPAQAPTASLRVDGRGRAIGGVRLIDHRWTSAAANGNGWPSPGR